MPDTELTLDELAEELKDFDGKEIPVELAYIAGQGIELTLTIEFGNEAMNTGSDVAQALLKIANKMNGVGFMVYGLGGTIMDANGNACGAWETRYAK